MRRRDFFLLAGLPLVASCLPGCEASRSCGISAPRVNREMNATFADGAMPSRFAAICGRALPGPPAAFGKPLTDETEQWAKVVKFARVSPATQ